METPDKYSKPPKPFGLFLYHKYLLEEYFFQYEYFKGKICDGMQEYCHWYSDSYISINIDKLFYSLEDIIELFNEFKGSELIPDSEIKRFCYFCNNYLKSIEGLEK